MGPIQRLHKSILNCSCFEHVLICLYVCCEEVLLVDIVDTKPYTILNDMVIGAFDCKYLLLRGCKQHKGDFIKTAR
jgi:hypothetical protein